MGSISGLKSNLLLVRYVHLQYTGSKPQEDGLLFMKYLLINTIAKETHTQVEWSYCWGLDNSPWVISHKFE